MLAMCYGTVLYIITVTLSQRCQVIYNERNMSEEALNG